MGRNKELLERAQKVIPGGVNSPVRAFKAVGGEPPFITRGKGCRVWDAEENEYVDYIASWGPLILGHAHPAVIDAVNKVLVDGSSFGAPTEREILFAEMLVERIPSIDMVRLVSSGTEATSAAIRLARGYTKRDKIIKLAGCYHGCVESLLVDAGSGMATFAIPGSPGITKGTAGDTLVVPFNDIETTTEIFQKHGKEIACIILEPVAGNMGVIPPNDGYLRALRELCDKHGSLLVFDEVMTGFRVHQTSAQELYKVTPDITCLGKVIGGGFPVGAYGARKEIMDCIAPVGPVYQAGTLSGNPIAVAAGIVTLNRLDKDTFSQIEARARRLEKEMREAAKEASVPMTINRVGTMMTLFFTEGAVTNYADAQKADSKRFAQYFQGMLKRGVHLAPSAFEAAFVGLAHEDYDIEITIEAHKATLKDLQ